MICCVCFACVGLVIWFLLFIICIKLHINAQEWFPILCSTLLESFKFRPNVRLWTPCLLQKYFLEMQEIPKQVSTHFIDPNILEIKHFEHVGNGRRLHDANYVLKGSRTIIFNDRFETQTEKHCGGILITS